MMVTGDSGVTIVTGLRLSTPASDNKLHTCLCLSESRGLISIWNCCNVWRSQAIALIVTQLIVAQGILAVIYGWQNEDNSGLNTQSWDILVNVNVSENHLSYIKSISYSDQLHRRTLCRTLTQDSLSILKQFRVLNSEVLISQIILKDFTKVF